MAEAEGRWRPMLFRSAVTIVAIDVLTYLCGVLFVNFLGTVDEKIQAGAWFFLVGSALSLFALILTLFGHGWHRIGLALACLLALPFWYGFTLY